MTSLYFETKIGAKLRIWLDTLPEAAMLSNDTRSDAHTFENVSASALRKHIAIEVFHPLGGSFHYGLLGGEFQKTQESRFIMTAPRDTPLPYRRYTDSLAGDLDRVTIGGLPEYASAILSVVQADPHAPPSGILTFTCMAYGDIGSAPIVFSSLARAVIRLLTRSEQPTSFDEARALLAN